MFRKKIINPLLVVACFYALVAYLFMPNYWKHYEHHPELAPAPKTTFNYEGLPGDAINIGVIGSEEDLVSAFTAAGWGVPDKRNVLTLSREVADILARRAYESAPISNLYLFGRKQDIAFERPSYRSPKKRHHVRFWRAQQYGRKGGGLWLGAATFDRGVGFSRYTGELTHHIDPNIDAERDDIVAVLERNMMTDLIYQVTGIGPTFNAKNAAGDRYYSDGELTVVRLDMRAAGPGKYAVHLPNPGPVKLKNRTWHAVIGSLLRKIYRSERKDVRRT